MKLNSKHIYLFFTVFILLYGLWKFLNRKLLKNPSCVYRKYLAITANDTIKNPCAFTAGHVLYYSSSNNRKTQYDILFQIRYDGYLGFVGGSQQTGENMLQCLKREIFEELTRSRKFVPNLKDVFKIYFEKKSKFCDHLFTKEINNSELQELAFDAHKSPAFGTEIMGFYILKVDVNKSENLTYIFNMPMIGNTLQQLIEFFNAKRLIRNDKLNSYCN